MGGRTAGRRSETADRRSTTKEVVEIRSTSMNQDDPIVEEVVRCEDLPPGSLAGRRMIVRWSDGTEGEAVRFYQDEVLFSEGDLVGRTREQIRSLHFCRDRDWLQS
jgi:hypothetical protein